VSFVFWLTSLFSLLQEAADKKNSKEIKAKTGREWNKLFIAAS
jgi:hypothetical protein